MPRAKAKISIVDLTRTMKAAKSAGLTITSTMISRDGSIILSHGSAASEPHEASPDDALSQWQAKQKQG